MSNIWIQESFVNSTEGYRFGDSDVYETYTDDRSKLFKDMQREYGRCESKIYIDGPDGKAIQVGWVFTKTMDYEDARADWPKERRQYVREVWITLHKAPPVVTTKYNYLYPRSFRAS
jgi:hypothetical protein